MKRLAYACSVLAILVLSAVSVFGQAKTAKLPAPPVPVGFKAFVIGSSIDTILTDKRFKETFSSLPYEYREFESKVLENETIAGQPVSVLQVTSISGKLQRVTLLIHNNEIEIIAKALAEMGVSI